MDREWYAVLAVIAIGAVGIGAATTAEPLGRFLVEGALEAGRTTAAMAWITWWALVVGFTIAGGVEAWVSSEAISEALEGAGPRELALGAFFGFVSSSCSYSAIATGKNLFKKGASAAAALGAFMFASTNLVVEIGLVIWLLLGWQFLAANLLGGVLLIGLMAAGFGLLVPDEVIETARENVADDDRTVRDPVCGMDVDPEGADHSVEHDGRTYYFCSERCRSSFDPEAARTSVREQATSLAGWAALAEKQWSEWGMLWDEIAAGFVLAGIIAGFVPDAVWTAVFAGSAAGAPAYVLWTAALGALVGVATFVCSVGNVPFGTVLWTKGLPFGAVLSYIYADLIVPPIVQAYREYYGRTFAAVLSGMIFASAVLAGVLVHYAFLGGGLIPPRSAAEVAEVSIEADYKLALNALATALFLALAYLRRVDPGADGHGARPAAD